MHNDARKTIINHHLYLNSKTSCDTSLARLTVAQLWLQCDPVNLLKTKGFRSTCFKGWVIPKCQGEHWCTTYIWTAPSKEAPGILFCIINSHFLSICQFADTFVFRDPFQCLARNTSANCSEETWVGGSTRVISHLSATGALLSSASVKSHGALLGAFASEKKGVRDGQIHKQFAYFASIVGKRI